MNQQQRSTTTSYSGSNGYGTARTKESEKDAQRRAMQKTQRDAAAFHAKADAAASDSAVIETLSPGEVAGGEIHLRKAPKGADVLVVILPLGDKKYEFSWALGRKG